MNIMKKRKNISTIVLFFVVLKIFGQTNLKIRTLGDYSNGISDTIRIETESIPSSLKELLEDRNESDNEEQGRPDASIIVYR